MNINDIFKVLSDPNRLRILNLLYGQELCVCELEYLLGLTQSNLSKHLRLMTAAGFLESRRENKFAYYKIKETNLTAHPFLSELFENELKKDAALMDERAQLKKYHESDLTCHSITTLLA